MRRNYVQSWFTFTKQYIKSPRNIGAICPSFNSLAKTMVSKIPKGNGLVIELGAGTGAITRELAQQIPNERLIIIEQVPWMVKELQQKFPSLTVLEADACNLSQYIPEGKHVDCIVSSLPFVSIEPSIRRKLIKEIKQVLNYAPMIQFTYSWGQNYLTIRDFTCISKKTVWKNIPPAHVLELKPKPF